MPRYGLVIQGSLTRFIRQWGVLLAGGAATIVVSVVAGRLAWPGWAAAVMVIALASAYLALRGVERMPARLATRCAERILRRHRAAHD
ncbi:hypothetical protein PJN95_29220, partial [Mycobacterium kansasii]